MMNASSHTPQDASASPTTAAQVLDTPGSPDKTLSAGVSNPTPKTPAQDEKISPKLQLLMSRERQAIERERAIAAREKEIEARLAEFTSRESRVKEFESVKQAGNSRKALELLGMSYQELTEAELNAGNVSVETQLRQLAEKFDSSQKAQEAAKRQFEEDSKKQQQEREAHAISNFKGEINTYLKDNASRYEFIAFEEEQDLVYDVIDEHFNRTLEAAIKKAQDEGLDPSTAKGEQLTIAQAADKVEAHLEKKYDKARELAKVKALMSRQTSPVQPEKQAPKQPTFPPRQTPQTLNNNLSATPSQPRKFPMTDDERIAKAIAYGRGLRP